MRITLHQAAIPISIEFMDGGYRIHQAPTGERALLGRQLNQWWQDGIVATLPDESGDRTVRITRRRITADHPRFVDIVVRRLRLLLGSDMVTVRSDVNEEQRVDQQLAVALRGMEQVATLRAATAEVRKVLPKLTFERKKKLADMLCV